MEQALDFDWALEHIIDREDLSKLLERLANICQSKAEHLRSNDERTAKLWERAGNNVYTVCASKAVENVS